MTPDDLALIVKSTAPVIREFVAAQVQPLLAKIAALESELMEVRSKALIPGPAGANGHDGKDGLGISQPLIDREGHLLLTMTDGTTKNVGLVVGKDGRDGLDGQEGALGARGEPGNPGTDGKDGRDGSVEQLKMIQLDERTIQWQFKDGTPVEGGTVRLSGFWDRGVWDQTKSYDAGDGVTLGGSFWIAQESTTTRPGTPGHGWRLAVKKGADGKTGPVGAHGPQGPRGDKGTDGRNGF